MTSRAASARRASRRRCTARARRRRRPQDPRSPRALSLFEQGFRVTTAQDAETARASMRGLVVRYRPARRHDAGRERPRARARDQSARRDIPICMLTARAEPEQRIEGLEIGVEDYVPKPFEPRELLLRLQNILRRGQAPPPPLSRRDPHGHLRVSHRPRRAASATTRPSSSPSASAIFCASSPRSAARPSSATSSRATTVTGSERAIDVQINRLRRKIESDPSNPVYLQTVRGKGYILYTD